VIDLEERARLWNLVEDTISRWRDGEEPDAAGFLARHPEIGSRKTLALDLIHEELCLRKELGDTVVAQKFIERFPDYRSSIAKMIAVEQYGEKNPGFAEALGEAAWPQVGQEYQGFEIVEPLGRGAVARVYLAREVDMGRRAVVIKVSPHGGHEAHLLGKLEHPNVVAAHSVKHDAASEMTVICMPLLGTATGLDLLDAAFRNQRPPVTAKIIGQVARQYQPAGLVKEESLSEAFPFARRSYVEGVVWLGKELAAGLVAAAKIGIAHRDIKPSNVLLAWSGRPMLLDFNLSSGEDQAGNRVGGTLAYMAPERIESLLADQLTESESFDPQPDIFSLGVVLYELLTGRLPVHPENAETSDAASMRRWLGARAQPVAPPSCTNSAVDMAIDAVVLRCLAEDPARRYSHAADLARELAEYLSPRQTAARWLRRNRRGVLAGSLAATAALVAGGVYWSRLPPYDQVKFEEGLALHQAGKYQPAIDAFDRSLERNAENIEARQARAESYYRLGLQKYDAGDYPGAILALDQSIIDNPKSVAALFARGQTYYWMGNTPAAEKDFVQAAKLENRGLFWFCAACCDLTSEAGSSHLYLALKAGYDEASVLCNLSINVYKVRGLKESLANFQGAIDRYPLHQQTYLERAHILKNEAILGDKKKRDLAISDIARAEELGPPSHRLYQIGAALHDLAIPDRPGSLDEAERYFRLMRACDDPQVSYKSGRSFPRLLAARPHLADLTPPPGFKFVPYPPNRIGVLPPKSADLELIVEP
jgi:serine/threonine protein kinase